MPQTKRSSLKQEGRSYPQTPPSIPVSPISNRQSTSSIDSPSALNRSAALLRSDLVIDLNSSIENISLREDYLSHSTLINIILALGYDIDTDGICYGFSTLAKNAILAGEFAKFEKRMSFINNNSPGSIIKALRKVKYKINHDEPLDKNDENYLELIIFFDNIVLAQDPRRKYHLFDNKNDWMQGSAASRKLVESEKLGKKGGEVELISLPAIFSREELIEFLNSYKKKSEKLGLKEPISLQFGAIGHAINVTYMPKTKEWILVDANVFKQPRQKSEAKATHHLPDAQSVANQVFNNYVALMPHHNRSPIYLGMTITAYATADNVSATKDFSKNLKKERIYTLLASRKNRKKAERTDLQNNTFLHMAARLPDYPISEIDFSDHKQCLNAQDHKGNTPLMMAIMFDNLEMAQALFAAGAKIDIENYEGLSPLYVAIRNHNQQASDWLIKNGADQNLNIQKLIPHSCTHFDKLMLNYFFKFAGADINAAYPFEDRPRTEKQPTHSHYIQPLIYALSKNKLDLAKYLIELGANVMDGIKWAIQQNSLPAFNFMLAQIPGQDNNAKYKALLELAIKNNDHEVLTVLAKVMNMHEVYLAQGSPFSDITNMDQNTALTLINLGLFTYIDFIKALEAKQEVIINAMLAHPEHLMNSLQFIQNLSQEDKNKLPDHLRSCDLSVYPVHIAVEQDDYRLAKKLLKHDFSVNTDDPHLTPPLHQAVQNGNERMVELLLRYHADKKTKYQNQTAYELAVSLNKDEVANLLKPPKKVPRRQSRSSAHDYRLGSTFSPGNSETANSPNLDTTHVTDRKKRKEVGDFDRHVTKRKKKPLVLEDDNTAQTLNFDDSNVTRRIRGKG